MKEYKRGTFDRHVAYGQRQRKLMLVSRGVLGGFKVRCESVKEAEDLAHAFRVRSRRIEESGMGKYRLRVKVDERTVYITQKGLLLRR